MTIIFKEAFKNASFFFSSFLYFVRKFWAFLPFGLFPEVLYEIKFSLFGIREIRNKRMKSSIDYNILFQFLLPHTVKWKLTGPSFSFLENLSFL